MKQKYLRISLVTLNISMVLFLIYLVRSQTEGYLKLRQEDGAFLMENMKHGFENYLISKDKILAVYAGRLKIIADAILLDQRTAPLSSSSLARSAEQYNVFRIMYVDETGHIRAYSRGFGGMKLAREFMDVVKGRKEFDTKDLRMNLWRTGYRFVVARHISEGGALIIVDEGSELQRFFDSISFRHIFSHLEHNEDMRYLNFQGSSLPERTTWSIPSDLDPSQIVLRAGFQSPARQGSDLTMRIVDFKGERTLELMDDIFFNSKKAGTLRIGLSLSYMKALQSHLILTVIAGALLLLILNLLFFFSQRLLNRLNREGNRFRWVLEGLKDGVLIETLEKPLLKNRAFDTLVPDPFQNLIATLPMGISSQKWENRSFLVLRSQMDATRLTLVRDTTLFLIGEEARNREERLFSMGQLTSSFAHEVRNPLNTISMSLQQIEPENLSEEEAGLLTLSRTEIQRLNQTVQQFLQVSRQPTLLIAPFALRPFLRDLASFFKARLDEAGTVLNIELNDTPEEISADQDQIRSVIVNLIENSLHAHATELTLKTSSEDGFICLILQDNGDGMDEETRKKAFDLYFTGRSDGSGLGLAYCHRVITAHNGFITIHSTPGEGTRVELFLPTETQL